jgi:RNA polymerase sigma-70 factor (ECF subfamily)
MLLWFAAMHDSLRPGDREFHTTRWSVVAAARCDPGNSAARRALASLCQDYWYPLYVFVRRSGHASHNAQDLTQAFFEDLLERDGFSVPPGKGKFRSYLLGALKHFLANDWRCNRAQKRGGGVRVVEWDSLEPEARYALEPADTSSPDALFDRRWALELLDRALKLLRAEFSGKGEESTFDALKGSLTGAELPREDVARQLGISPAALKVAVHRLRKRYREVLQAEIAGTVDSPEEIAQEMRHLADALRLR